MKPIPLVLPPGAFYPGSAYDARGRWYKTNLVRWEGPTLEAVGGWTPLLEDDDSTVVTAGEVVRGMLGWVSNDGVDQLAFGGPTKLYHFTDGVLSDITPTDLVTGDVSSSYATGLYGVGSYGVGAYGQGSGAAIIEAQTWQLANFGQDLLALAYSDRRIYRWQVGDDAATALPNAPTNNRGVVVTPERFAVAIGADSDDRQVKWSDQEDAETWTPAGGNQAGDLVADDVGSLLAGRALRNETLIWSTTSLHALRYIGGTLVYSLQRVGSGCGAVSRHAMAVMAGRAYWMGHRSFFMYDGGSVREIPCDVSEYVFKSIHADQLAKVVAWSQRDFNEVWWFFPSSAGGNTENDRYVKLNVETGAWDFGELERTSGTDRGVPVVSGNLEAGGSGSIYDLPLAADADGTIYVHETGTSYLDPDDAALTPYAESGPIEIADGENIMHVMGLIPAEGAEGTVTYTLYSALYPKGSETTRGPYTSATKINTRFHGRQVRLRVAQATAGWRLGTPRLLVRKGGKR